MAYLKVLSRNSHGETEETMIILSQDKLHEIRTGYLANVSLERHDYTNWLSEENAEDKQFYEQFLTSSSVHVFSLYANLLKRWLLSFVFRRSRLEFR
jgi:ABC-type cobalamin/Fe3+-siderophores transport system ATPase subunit